MNIVRINSRNVIFVLLTILSTTLQQAHTGHESASKYAQKEANENPIKEENARLCPSGVACTELHSNCLKCHLNSDCEYGSEYIVNCTVRENIDCIGVQSFQKKYICRYCYQTEHWEHECHQKNSCNSVSSPRQYYRTNCTVNGDILCLGRRTFMKNLLCNWTVGYRWSTALILSITLGGFGADRFYLGHWQEGIGKLFSFGGFGVWTLIDVILIYLRYIGPADGSLYI